MVTEVGRVDAVRTMLGSIRQMVIDPGDYDDSMQLAGEPQKPGERFGTAVSGRPHSNFGILEGTYLVTWSTTSGGSNE
jgi:hypothetical protein